jgi:hypothetical protein
MTDLKNKIINMKVISKLQPHVRLDTSGTLFKIYQPVSYQPIWFSRWWAQHNRSQDIARVTLLYQDIIKELEGEHKDQIKKALKESINGLNNLKTTYEEDITCSASIEYIIELITPHISS